MNALFLQTKSTLNCSLSNGHVALYWALTVELGAKEPDEVQ